jgi:phospholipid-binding lipoprotein MlaA
MNLSPQTRALKGVLALGISMGLTFAVSGCATGPGSNPRDPFEKVNRATYKVNDTIDTVIATPIAKGYNFIVPQFVRTMVNNFFSNIGDATVMANDILQGRGTDAAEDLMRMAMNSVFGIGGLFDFATEAGLPRHDQDFGLTLGHYGVPMGPYIVIPLFGPSDVRDGIGLAAALEVDPIGYTRPAVRNAFFIANFVSTRAKYLGATDLLSAAALDKYSFTRDAYLGHRQYLLDGGTSSEPLPDYGVDPATGASAPAATPVPAPVPGAAPGVVSPAVPAVGASAAAAKSQ